MSVSHLDKTAIMNSIRVKIIFIVLISILLLGGVFVYYTSISNREIKESYLNNVSGTLLYESERINKTIRVLEQNAIDLAHAGRSYYMVRKTTDEEHGNDIVLTNFATIPESVGGGVWYERFAFNPDVERFCIYACWDEKGALKVDSTFNTPEYDFPTQDWYIQIKGQLLEGKNSAWSHPYYDETGTLSLMTTVGSGIFDDNGKFVGMSTIDWQIQEIINNLNNLPPTENSFVTLLDPVHGMVVAHTQVNGEAHNKKISDLEWADRIPELNSENIVRALFDIDSQNYISFGRKLDNGMLLIINVPINELTADISKRNTLSLLSVTILTLAIILFMVYFLDTKMNRPLKKLMRGAANLGKGELDTTIEIKGNDEFATLGDTFNRMTSDLKDHIDHLKTVTSAKEKIESELKIAQDIQKGILPAILPPFPDCDNFKIDAVLKPAREVGGDLYDFFMITPRKVALITGDVSGKGVPASLFMAVTQILHRGLTHDGNVDTSQIVNKMNRSLCINNNAGMFVTYVVAVIDLDTGVMTYTNAGHDPFYILKADGTLCEPCMRHGIPLGVRVRREYEKSELTLEGGDTLFFYTDGVPEAKNANGEFFGMNRLKTLLAELAKEHLSPMEIDQRILQSLADFVQDAEQFDDITMTTFQIKMINTTDGKAE